MIKITHPAKYTDSLLPVFASMIGPGTKGLDPFGGTGKIFKLHDHHDGLQIHCIEIEPDWAAFDSRIEVGNALDLPFANGSFDWVCTSPAYGNRMADHHKPMEKCSNCRATGLVCGEHGNALSAKHLADNPHCDNRNTVATCPKCDGTGYRKHKRNTYRHCLGKPLQSENSGQLQWGKEYKAFHTRAWLEVLRVLKPGGIFILNCKNHIRKKEVIKVCEWHAETIVNLGFSLFDVKQIKCPGNRQGQNGSERVEHEMVYKFVKINSQPPD